MDIPSAIECVCEEGHCHAPRVPDAPEPAPEPGTIPVTRIEDLRPGDWARVRLEEEGREAFLEGEVWTATGGRLLRIGFAFVRWGDGTPYIGITLVSAHRPDPLAGVEWVVDYDGDLWRRTGPDEWTYGGGMRRATRDLLSAHGPVTPLHPGEEVTA